MNATEKAPEFHSQAYLFIITGVSLCVNNDIGITYMTYWFEKKNHDNL